MSPDGASADGENHEKVKIIDDRFGIVFFIHYLCKSIRKEEDNKSWNFDNLQSCWNSLFYCCLSNVEQIKSKIMAYMSQEGYDKLVAELRRLESIERPKASAAIAEARDKGDLSENSEYDAAKEAQAHLESKINKMKLTIAEAKIVDMSRLSTDTVQIMCKVEMTNVANQAKMTYTIVSESEANLREGKISIHTPIAQGLLGKRVGEVADIKIPNGVIHLRIDSISID